MDFARARVARAFRNRELPPAAALDLDAEAAYRVERDLDIRLRYQVALDVDDGARAGKRQRDEQAGQDPAEGSQRLGQPLDFSQAEQRLPDGVQDVYAVACG